MMRSLALLLLASLVGRPLHAQAPGPLDEAVKTITPADVRGRIEVLSDDSMLGRDTPSPGLERAAKYVIAAFQRLGLRPAGDSGTYAQRYGLSRWTVDTAASAFEVSAKGASARVPFGSDVRLIGGEVSGKRISDHAI